MKPAAPVTRQCLEVVNLFLLKIIFLLYLNNEDFYNLLMNNLKTSRIDVNCIPVAFKNLLESK